MAQRVTRVFPKVIEVAHQFEAHHYRGDDGYPTADVFSPIYIVLEDGREFVLPMGKQVVCEQDGFVGYVASYQVTDQLINDIRRLGVNLDKWLYVEPRPSLEELWGPEAAQRERDDAMMGFDRW